MISDSLGSKVPRTASCNKCGISIFKHIEYMYVGCIVASPSSFSLKSFIFLFAGSYEKGSKPRYKHIYFNLTHQTLKIWALSAVAFILFYESVKKLCILIKGDQARWSMVILFCSVIYPHYYGWWMYFNAWNDDFYDQWYHQAFFSLTELASTIVVFYFCDNERLLQPRLLLFIMDIAILHILASGGDQFISNVILKKGAWFQFTRDIGFMIPDLLHIVIPAFELRRLKNQRGARFWDIFSHSDIFLSIFLISVLWFIVSHL